MPIHPAAAPSGVGDPATGPTDATPAAAPPELVEQLSARELARRYAGVLLDLDGVCYRGSQPIPGAGAAIDHLRAAGLAVRFVTNNASRTPQAVASLLVDVGVRAAAEDVVSSAQAAASLLAPGARCLVIGMEGVHTALRDRGCQLVDDPRDADAVVVGLDTELTWHKLCAATTALDHGARFIGTNGDVSFPSEDGRWPDNGAILAALTAATGREPEVAGKPHAPLLRAAAAGLPDGPRLMIGDRLETDIVGAQHLGWDTLLVLSGIADERAGRAADPPPTMIATSLAVITD